MINKTHFYLQWKRYCLNFHKNPILKSKWFAEFYLNKKLLCNFELVVSMNLENINEPLINLSFENLKNSVQIDCMIIYMGSMKVCKQEFKTLKIDTHFENSIKFI